MAEPPVWDHRLPVELLELIFSRLPSFTDRACCSGVCRAWRDAATLQEHEAPPRLPLLLRPSRSEAGPSYFGVFSKTITVQPAIPDGVRGARFCGSSPGGNFIIARQQSRDYALINIFSGEENDLPDGLDGVAGVHPGDLVILAAAVSPRLNPKGGGDYVVAAIAAGQHNALFCSIRANSWTSFEPQMQNMDPMLREFEDVMFYDSQFDEPRGFYFLTSRDGLLVFIPQYGDEHTHSDTFYIDGGDPEVARPLKEAGQVVARRYLMESRGNLLMVQRVVSLSPGRGTVSFRIFTLHWPTDDRSPYWEPTSRIGALLFVGPGCSRAIDTGRFGPAFIYFLDDADGFPDVETILDAEKLYRCGDTGWFRNDTGYICKSWPQGAPPNCSPWIWFHH